MAMYNMFGGEYGMYDEKFDHQEYLASVIHHPDNTVNRYTAGRVHLKSYRRIQTRRRVLKCREVICVSRQINEKINYCCEIITKVLLRCLLTIP